MKDPRITKLAENLIGYSTQLQPNQIVIIEGTHQCRDLIVALVKRAQQIGAFPMVRMSDEQVGRQTLMGITEEQSKLMARFAKPLFEAAHAYIGIGASSNVFESADVPTEKKNIHTKYYGKPIHIDIRVKRHNWCILRWPSASMAQLAHTSVDAFEDFYFDVCNLDYGKMHRAMLPLKDLMDKTDKVRIIAPDTDLSFSIKGQTAQICSGRHNIPDGEIFTTPVKKSVNGKIRFNIPSAHKGIEHSDITLTVKNGKVVEEKSNSTKNTKQLKGELDSDNGARYFGEFALGVNPYITEPMLDTLFDEKMVGSIHLALGNCYPDSASKDNVNKSQLHWDLVLSQTEENGGGEIYFDGVLVRKDGVFVLPELEPLNPENLK